MAFASPVILILGAGANIGQHVARAFAAKGYKVALTSRKANSSEDTPNEIHIATDLSNPASVSEAFSKVKESFGAPSVVVYNAAAATSNSPEDPLSLNIEAFTRDLHINTTSAFAAAQQASLAFSQLPSTSSRTFIYTGNILNTDIIPSLLSLGVGKSATAHFVQIAATAYKEKGFKFYYADERQVDGRPVYSNIDGPAAAEHYLTLAEGKTQGPWSQTFVKGIGYKDFSKA